MADTNFLTPAQDLPPAAGPRSVKKPRKKIVRRKSARGGAVLGGKVDKSPFKLGENLTVDQSMPKIEPRIKKNPIAIKKNLPPARAGGAQIGEARKVYRKIAFSFIALTVILVFAVLYFGFSKVTLVIIPTQEKIADSLSLTIIDKDSNAAIGLGEIQGVVRQVPVEQSRTFTASGKEVLGEEVSGKVTLINNYLKNQPLVASTRLLSSDNKLFRLKETVNVPAGGKVEAAVYADEAKPEMAIGPSRFTIPGLWAGLQDKIYALSQAPMVFNQKVKYIIQQSDIDNAISQLKNDLLANAKQEIGQAYQEYDQSMLQVDNNSVNQEVQGKVGQEKENFSIKMKTKVTLVAFKSNDVYREAEAKLVTALADDKQIVEFIQPDTTYNLGSLDLKQGTASLNVNYDAKVTLKNTAGIIKKNNLAGLSEAQLKAYLNSLPEISGYEVKFFPSFVRKMPNLVDRIEVVIKK